MNGVNSRTLVRCHLGLGSRNNENVFVARRVLVDVRDLLVNVPLHPTAERRIKLGQIANLQRIAEVRLAIADLRDAAMMATSSLASPNNGSTCFFRRTLESMINSSASSSTTPI